MRAKFLRSTALSFVAVASTFTATSALADSHASVNISDNSCPATGCMLVGDNFNFTLTPGPHSVPPGGFAFTNDTGTVWHSLKITEVGYVPDSVTCLSSAFEKCTVTDQKDSVTVMLWGVGGQFTGVAPGQSFRIALACPHCGPNQTITFTAVAATPEPATLGLMGTGLFMVGAAVYRRRNGV